MNGNKDRIEAVFQAAMELGSSQEREAYLQRECGEDAELRREVEELLTAAAEAEGVFETRLPRPALEQAGSRIGHYRLLQKIGEGGCGVVYMAEQERPMRRKVALKIVKLGMDTRQVIARFEAERQALALMDHPNIAKVLDAGATETGRPYFVMELVRGHEIIQYCDEQRFSTPQRLNLFIQVCQAVQHAHQKGIIHRDLKPSNVLVTERDGVPIAKVIDFGIAKATCDLQLTDKTLFTAFDQFIGTLAYMSPEQARLGELDIDTRSDIYSLGVLLYELVTGQPPFEPAFLKRLAMDQVLKTIRETDPPLPSNRFTTMTEEQRTMAARSRQVEPSALQKLVHGDLDWIVMKCLEKDRTRRYETANGLGMDISRFLKHLPVMAAAPAPGYQIRKFVQRNRTGVIAIMSVALALVIGATTSGWLAVIATRSKNGAMIARNNEIEINRELNKQVSETEHARRVSEDALERMQIQKAEELFGAGQASTAIAYLGQLLRANPSNQVASTRLVSAMIHRKFPNQLTEPLRHGNCLASDGDGRLVVTASGDNTARVWDAITGQPITGPLQHEAPVQSAQFSTDGLMIVTVSEDRTARVWDAKTGAPLTQPLRHEADVRWVSAKFSPDGRVILTATGDTTGMNQKVWIWSARTGKQIAGPLLGESAPEFSPNGKSFLTISTNGVRLWATDTGEGLPIAFRAEAPIRSAHFSPNGHWIVTACSDKTARVWDATSGKAITEAIRHETEIFDATFSPDSQRVLTVSMDNKSRMWDIHTGQMISQPIPGALHFSPDGQRALVTSVEGVFVWELEAGKAITEALRYENKTTFAPQLSTDGKRIVIGSEDAGVSILDAHNGGLLSEPLRHPGAFTMGEFSPNGHRVVTFSWDETARVWDAFTGRLLFEPLQHEASILSAQFSPDGLRVLTASIDKTAREWDANTGKPLIELRHEASVYSAQFSPDGRWILTLSFDHKARLWDAQTGKPTEVCVSGVSLAQISPDGQWVVTAGRDNTAQVWLVNTGQSVGVPLRHEGEIISVRFSPDSHCIVTASKDKTARVWDTATGELIAGPFRHEGEVFSALFSPDSRWVVTASDDKTARVWDARSGQPLTESLRHEGRVNSAEFSADGTRVVTASDDKTALVWDVNTGERLTEPLLHRGSVLSAQFSPDGQRILTTCSDGAARVWDEGAAQVPVPIWFIEWAEAQAGRRFNSQRLDVAVSTTEQRECRQQVAGRKDTDFFTLVAQWIQADPETRTISPFSPITVADYVNRRVQESTVLSLREAIRLSPTNSLAFARLAELLKDMDPKLSPGCLDEAQFYAEYSLKQDPINAEAWRALAGIQFLRTQTVDALRSVDRAVELKPGSYQSWEAKGNMLEKSGRTSEALEAYSQALQLFRHPAELPSVEVKRVLLSRARVFKTLNRLREAGEDICAAYGVPLRQGTLAPLLLDLSIFYNAGFRGNWHGDLRENDLSELPVGTQRLAGVSFDVRGLIQIGNIPESAKDFPFIQASNVFETNRFPQEILGIPVGRACRSLNFLHAAINAGTETSAKAGEQIGFYRLHYASRQLREIPIVLGKDVTDWWTQNNEPSPSAGGPVVAWTGTNGDSRRENRSIRLFKTHWENPLPDDKIETIDFVSSHLLAAPFLVAITVEQ